MKRTFLKLALGIGMTIALTFPAMAEDGWHQEGDARYYYQDGVMLVNQWLRNEEGSYYLGPDGKALTGVQFIDGWYYNFRGDGNLGFFPMVYGRDVQYIFDEAGRGTAHPLTSEDALIFSTAGMWISQLSEIYEEHVDWAEVLARAGGKSLPSTEERLQRDWGISTREELLAQIEQLYEAGKAAENKADKAWNFGRAAQLVRMGDMDYWDLKEGRNILFDMTPAIQQSFDSWSDYFDNYMTGYRNWAAAVGVSSEQRELREKSYQYILNQALTWSPDSWIEWNAPLVKTW